MKYLLLSFLFIANSASAQMPEEIKWKFLVKTYNLDSTRLTLSLNNKLLNGAYKIPTDDGGYELIKVRDGEITGDVYWYAANGRQEAKLKYKNGVRNGLKENYDHDNQVWLRQNYKDGKLHGDVESYISGKLSHLTSYKNGKKDGKDLIYADGNLISETFYKNGLKNGMSNTYNISTGKLTTSVSYLNDLKNGMLTMYNNGVKSMEDEYKNDLRHGVSYMYKPDGITVLFENYNYKNERVTKEKFLELTAKDN